MAEEFECRMGQVEQMIRHTYWSSGCTGIIVGVSGGVDSALAAAFCCRAIGPDKVLGLSLPASVSNPQDVQDARELCTGLGIEHRVVSIDPMLAAFATLPGFVESPYLSGNLMARIRMTVLYYHANRDHRLVCGTSNRSEFLLGYCTKYGDNAADFQPIVHLYKTDVYEMAKKMKIPASILTKTPSAGLWAGQSDEGEIGLSYDEIDAALKNLEAHDWKAGSPAEEKVLVRAQKNAHKRFAAPNLLTSQ